MLMKAYYHCSQMELSLIGDSLRKKMCNMTQNYFTRDHGS